MIGSFKIASQAVADNPQSTFSFSERVSQDGGTLENLSNVLPFLNEGNSPVLAMLPSGKKATTLYNQIPNETIISETELVVNGGFDTDTDWTLQPEWSILNGTLNSLSTALYSSAEQTAIMTIGKTYKITFEPTIFVPSP